MAISRVTLNHGNITSHFQATPLSGTGRGGGRGLARGDANAIAARMALQARINASGYEQRTGRLVASVVPIVRTGRGGDVEVGVGTTVEHGKFLEMGTHWHLIRARNAKLLQSNTPKWIALKGEVPEKWELERKHKTLSHPGNRPGLWMSDAVRAVIPGARVRVRALK